MKRTVIPLCMAVILILAGSPYGKESRMKISSTAFGQNGQIPAKYTCDGADINPPLAFEAVPSGAKSLALIVDDPDAPMGTWVHWVVWNIDPKTRGIAENSIAQGAMQGTTDFGKRVYGGPCPPSGTHRYFFKLYALDLVPDMKAGARKADLEAAMKGHILEETQLMGLYKRGR